MDINCKLINEIQFIAKMEILLNVPPSERITDWFVDYHMYEPKLGVSDDEIEQKYNEYKELENTHNEQIQTSV